MAKIKIDDIKKDIEEKGWKLISESYKNLDEELIFECEEGHRVYAPWKKIRVKAECPICQSNIYKTQEDTSKIIPKKEGTKRVLGLDQATYKCGYAILDDGKLIKHGVFETSHEDEIARDSAIKSWLISLITNWQPDCIGIEGIQLQDRSNGNSIMGVTIFETLARLQGIIMETCYYYKIPYKVCHTATWRNHCNIKGRTRVDRKRSMQLKIKEWYDITVSDDAADAIGIAKYTAEKASLEIIKTENWE